MKKERREKIKIDGGQGQEIVRERQYREEEMNMKVRQERGEREWVCK